MFLYKLFSLFIVLSVAMNKTGDVIFFSADGVSQELRLLTWEKKTIGGKEEDIRTV